MRATYAARMTIDENLEFSVLTAPVAAFDRRALSQAWYSALYDRHAPQLRRAGKAPKAELERAIGFEPPARAVARNAQRSGIPMGRVHMHVRKLDPAAMDCERRQPRSPLARKIERAFLRPTKSVPRRAAFSLEGSAGRVQVMLQSEGSELKLIAICPARAREQVVHALAQARYALALRGIRLNARTLETATSC